MELSLKLPLTELENTLDLISYRLTNLKYASDIENFLLEKIKLSGMELIIFRKRIPISLATTMCKEIDFPIITLENVPYFDDLSQEILLNTEVTVSSNTIYALDLDCILRMNIALVI